MYPVLLKPASKVLQTKHGDSAVFLIIIPVQEKQGERTHHKEE